MASGRSTRRAAREGRPAGKPAHLRAHEAPLVDVCRYISFEGLRDALTAAHDYISFLKPDWLQKISESCALEEWRP